MISLKPRDTLLLLAILGVVSAATAVARLLLPDSWWAVALVLCLGALLLVHLDTYRRLQSTLIQFHDEPGQNDRQIEALFSLFALLPIRAALPRMRGAAISPDLAAQIATAIVVDKPRTVVELGSGVSTLIGGYALRAAGGGRLISLEESGEYASQTRDRVKQHGLGDVVTVVHAPLKPVRLRDEDWEWYDLGALGIERGIDLVVVDGPLQIGKPGHPIRYPALPLLLDRLSADCTLIVDDCNRPQEAQAVERWLREFPEFVAEQSHGEKQHVILRRRRRA